MNQHFKEISNYLVNRTIDSAQENGYCIVAMDNNSVPRFAFQQKTQGYKIRRACSEVKSNLWMDKQKKKNSNMLRNAVQSGYFFTCII